MARSKKATQSQSQKFTVTLHVNGAPIVGSGDTLNEAVLNLPAFTPKTQGKMVVTYDGKDSRTMLFHLQALKRLFFPGMTGQIQRMALEKQWQFYRYAE